MPTKSQLVAKSKDDVEAGEGGLGERVTRGGRGGGRSGNAGGNRGRVAELS